MKILHISDTHGQHGRLKDLPAADVIVHSGDFTFGGEVHEAIGFLNWFCDLPYAHKIFIAGNHDDCLYDVRSAAGNGNGGGGRPSWLYAKADRTFFPGLHA